MFDRSVVNKHRRILDFGLCDINGVYQLTSKLRASGWLVVTFFKPGDPCSEAVLSALNDWAAELTAGKVSILGVLSGDRILFDKFKESTPTKLSVVWDVENYWATNWGLSELPTTFVVDSAGCVLDRIVGADSTAFNKAKVSLAAILEKEAEAKAAAATSTVAAVKA